MDTRSGYLGIIGLNGLLLLMGLGLEPSLDPATPNETSHLSRWQLQWESTLPPLDPTWPDQPRYSKDQAYLPVPAGDQVLIASSREDWVQALDSESGQSRWRFFCDGPVRFAPAVWKGHVFAASDDGYLYCLDLDDGHLLWKVRGGPTNRRILGNERLISTWPARGAPVVAEEDNGRATVYFAAGIWPFMGIFLHAVDAETGANRWTNSEEGSIFIKQPHQADAFAGIAPQGKMVVLGDNLLVPSGRSITACFDRHTGKRRHFRLADASKISGGPEVHPYGDSYVNGGAGLDLETGNLLGLVSEPVAVDGPNLFSVVRNTCRHYRLERKRPHVPDSTPDKKKKPPITEAWLGSPEALVSVPRTTVLVARGNRLFGAGKDLVYSVDLAQPSSLRRVEWQHALSGTPVHLSADNDRLYVSTREGKILAFGPPTELEPLIHTSEKRQLPAVSPQTRERVARIIQRTGSDGGYAILFGVGDGESLCELVQKSQMNLICVEPNPEKAANWRKQLVEAGVPGKRASILPVAAGEANLPPYLASLILREDPAAFSMDQTSLPPLLNTLRPQGGLAILSPRDEAEKSHLQQYSSAKNGEYVLDTNKEGLAIRRPGPPPGAGNWTHQNADAANTRVGKDRLVKAPLGLLWFGGPGNQGILPRHGHGPVPQVCDGRLFIEGPDRLRALDVYTGRLLWETVLPGVGRRYDNEAHQPGANASGSNYVSLSDGVFIFHHRQGLRLDPATGKVTSRYELPPYSGQTQPAIWTFLTVEGPFLVAGSDPPLVQSIDKSKKKQMVSSPSTSKRLTVMDRATGKVLYSLQARHGFRHHSICLGGGKLFAIDRPADIIANATKDPQKSVSGAELVVHDLNTGKRLWKRESDIFGSWLSYSIEKDVLVESGLMARDALFDESPGMRAFQGSSGKVLWNRPDYFGPALIHGDQILKGGDAAAGSGTACDLMTGSPIRKTDPLTGKSMEWKWVRTYGCNTPAASENLLLFRSGAAGYFDLCTDSGTGNLGGFRSSCTLNLIPAGGILTAPDYTRTCVCSYQNQCSVAFIHMPDADQWTFTTARTVKEPISRIGLNLAAPGTRRPDLPELWLEYPQAGGPGPKLDISTEPPSPEMFRHHPSLIQGEGPRFVASSGFYGLQQLTLALGKDGEAARRFHVKLVFCEPDDLGPGKRIFSVGLQDRIVESDLDISRLAGGPRRVLVREYHNIEVRGRLSLSLIPQPNAEISVPVLSGIEVREIKADENQSSKKPSPRPEVRTTP